MTQRISKVTRKTKETQITIALNLDGTGEAKIDTGVGFFNHMLESFARHGFFDLEVKCEGDLFVDSHHSIEDVGIVMGQALKEALGDKKGICRFGYFILPMDESLMLCSLDLSGRPYFSFDVDFTVPKIGDMDTEMVKEFFYAISYTAEMNLHLKQISGGNNHHMAEGLFKAFGKALDEAVMGDKRIKGVLSTKGSL